MTFPELRVQLKELKHASDLYLNLFPEYDNTAENPRFAGLYVVENGDMWDVFEVNERGGRDLAGRFYTQEDACEYIYCFFKKDSDYKRWF